MEIQELYEFPILESSIDGSHILTKADLTWRPVKKKQKMQWRRGSSKEVVYRNATNFTGSLLCGMEPQILGFYMLLPHNCGISWWPQHKIAQQKHPSTLCKPKFLSHDLSSILVCVCTFENIAFKSTYRNGNQHEPFQCLGLLFRPGWPK